MKKTILISAITSIFVNLVLSSKFFPFCLFLFVWLFMGYVVSVFRDLGDCNTRTETPTFACYLLPPIAFVFMLWTYGGSKVEYLENFIQKWFPNFKIPTVKIEYKKKEKREKRKHTKKR